MSLTLIVFYLLSSGCTFSMGKERCEIVASISRAKTRFLHLPSKESCSSSLFLLISCACCAPFPEDPSAAFSWISLSLARECWPAKGLIFWKGIWRKLPQEPALPKPPLALEIGAQTQVPWNSTHSVWRGE